MDRGRYPGPAGSTSVHQRGTSIKPVLKWYLEKPFCFQKFFEPSGPGPPNDPSEFLFKRRKYSGLLSQLLFSRHSSTSCFVPQPSKPAFSCFCWVEGLKPSLTTPYQRAI
ncbi:hypothetical protein TNIN_420121 [Trichonephila inaurata madagascariensis]|uniref:Uncharacterized protein n=1 Tax=Trichonephila inaurata madagascariensis TaxID=2747483 RepID=A0A8X6WTY7_9ARAC|nr:hypothetical protein TNIN_420121 [Trichonephila inaurata madagascariensis]